MTQWKVSELFPNYEVSEFGDVRRAVASTRAPIGRPVKPRLVKGYKYYHLCLDGKMKHIKAARLVLECFVGPRPFDGAEICHGDGVRVNDHYSNLRWDTQEANHADKVAHGTVLKGESHGMAKLNEAQVVEIRSLAAMDGRWAHIASQFGISPATIADIMARRSWAHVA